jgi:hypothetical protein
VPLLQVSWTTTARCLSFIVQYKEPLRTANDLTLVLLLLHLSINPRQHLLSIAILRMCCCSFFGSLSISLFCTHQARLAEQCQLPELIRIFLPFKSSSMLPSADRHAAAGAKCRTLQLDLLLAS